MADAVAQGTDNIENQPNDANHGDVTEPLKKTEVTETSNVDEAGDADKTEEPVSEEADDTASRKRKSEVGTVPDEDEEESKKAKTDDVPPTNGSETESNDQPDVTTKTVEDVQRLANEGDEEVAA